MSPALSTCLWFAPDQAERAVEFYVETFPCGKVLDTQRFRNEQQPSGEVQVWTLEIGGAPVHVMGSAGEQPFTMSHSMWLVVDDQQQLDHVWDAMLAAGGKELACGWIVDPFGVHWQIVPRAWERLVAGGGDQAQRVAETLWGMVRPDVARLEAAAEAR